MRDDGSTLPWWLHPMRVDGLRGLAGRAEAIESPLATAVLRARAGTSDVCVYEAFRPLHSGNRCWMGKWWPRGRPDRGEHAHNGDDLAEIVTSIAREARAGWVALS